MAYTSYGLLNSDHKENPDTGNVIWGGILAKMGIAPIYFSRFSIFEPVGKKIASERARKAPAENDARAKSLIGDCVMAKTTADGIIGGQDDGRMTAVPDVQFMDDTALLPASTRRITPRYGPSSWQ